MHQGSGVRLRVIGVKALKGRLAGRGKAAYTLVVRNEGVRDAVETVAVITSPHERLRLLPEMLRFGDIPVGKEGRARIEARSEALRPGKYEVKIVLSAVGVAATTSGFVLDVALR